MDGEYYTTRKAEFLQAFDEESQSWRLVIANHYGDDFANSLLREARQEFEALLAQIPYIGGDENHLTGALIESAQCLALYQAMRKRGKTATETGKVLYEAAVAQTGKAQLAIPPAEAITTEQLMERRRTRAMWSQERRYPEDYVYELVAGDGEEFDYGYDFQECAAQKFYHAHDADELTPFYCYLDFPKSTMGLRRTMALSEGYTKCNHRFKAGRKVELSWPPPFLKNE
jgi:hypothetical protein